MKADTSIAALARDQHGLFTHAQALNAGVTTSELKRRVERGLIERVHHGVYRIAGATPGRDQRLLAACLLADGVASHRSAAELWEMSGVEHGLTEVSVTTGHRPRARIPIFHRTRDLAPHHVTELHRVPVTNPMRTLVDLGAVVPRWVVQQAVDDTLNRRLVTMPGLVGVWRDVARPGRAGSGVLRWAIEDRLPRPSASRLEKQMLRLHRRYGLAEPEVEYVIRDERGRFVGRVDFAHVADRVVIEVDGYATHSSKEAFLDDRVRDRRLRALGWTVLRFAWIEVEFAPDEVAREIETFLASQAREGSG